MNDTARQKLVEIIDKHGVSVIENPRRCEGLIRDYCPGFRREISVLTMALEERIPLDLLAAKSTPREVLLRRLTQRLCDDLALSEQAGYWAVNSWAFALKVISNQELKEFERQYSGQAYSSNIAVQSSISSGVQNKTQPNTIQSNNTSAINVSVRQSVIVSAEGGANFSTIGEAVKNSPAGARLIIRPGIYNESVIIDKDLEISGEGRAEDVIIVGTQSSCIQVLTEKAILRGLTIQGRGAKLGRSFFAVDIPKGELLLENCDVSSDSLSCVAIHGAYANPFLKNCRIHDGADSGIYFFDNARGRVENCDVHHNRNVGAAITQGANPLIVNSRIYEGDSGGVVVWSNGASGTIEDCVIFGHRLANVGISEYANPTFRRCKIYGSRDAGVFIQQNGYGKLEDCDVYGNEDAEVAVSTNGNPVLRGCLLHDGNASGIVVRDKGRALIDNCKIYDNADAGVSILGGSIAAVRRCNIHRNRTVAVRVKEKSAVSVEDCDLRGNRLATWESEAGVMIERKNNRE
ncbi:MAG TPA: right-handed parallel beta-helix repeat-containing protein [Pyrinomonadaceae bacterium]|jgi:hypothetical protein